jgi:hypothetical protein
MTRSFKIGPAQTVELSIGQKIKKGAFTIIMFCDEGCLLAYNGFQGKECPVSFMSFDDIVEDLK